MLDRKKHRQEVESLKADNRMKDMELGKAYVDEFRSNIARPLQEEVKDWLSPSSFAFLLRTSANRASSFALGLASVCEWR